MSEINRSQFASGAPDDSSIFVGYGFVEPNGERRYPYPQVRDSIYEYIYTTAQSRSNVWTMILLGE